MFKIANAVWSRVRMFHSFLPPNVLGVWKHPPGHFYSPLIDLRNLKHVMAHDGIACWENIDLNAEGQRALYRKILQDPSRIQFPRQAAAGFRYFWDNSYFRVTDGTVLSGIIQGFKPNRIIEVGSGFSSAAILDTLQRVGWRCDLTFIEPFADRLLQLIGSEVASSIKIEQKAVQDVPVQIYDRLGAGDILLVDSTHVAKIGSDVSHLWFRVFPRLKAGVLIHIHDIFYPNSYPEAWIQKGRAWNESLVVKAVLANSRDFRVMAFNPFALQAFPDVFAHEPAMKADPGGSLWLQKQ